VGEVLRRAKEPGDLHRDQRRAAGSEQLGATMTLVRAGRRLALPLEKAGLDGEQGSCDGGQIGWTESKEDATGC
jgi:hypothetical protein